MTTKLKNFLAPQRKVPFRVTLQDDEVAYGNLLGRLRDAWKLVLNIKDKRGAKTDSTVGDFGAVAEVSVVRGLQFNPILRINTFGDMDFGSKIEVKASRSNTRTLVLDKKYAERSFTDEVIIHIRQVEQGNMRSWDIVGWLFLSEAVYGGKDNCFFEEHPGNGGDPAFFIPFNFERCISTLPPYIMEDAQGLLDLEDPSLRGGAVIDNGLITIKKPDVGRFQKKFVKEYRLHEKSIQQYPSEILDQLFLGIDRSRIQFLDQ